MDHQFYHRILDHLPNIVCVVQNDGNLYNLLYGNLLFYQMMNSQDEIHRVHPHRSFTQEFIHGEDLNKFLAARSILLHSGQVSTDIGACRTLCFLGNHRCELILSSLPPTRPYPSLFSLSNHDMEHDDESFFKRLSCLIWTSLYF